MKISISILALVPALVSAQGAFTCTIGNPATFNQCATNSQVSPAGQIGAKTPTDACSSVQTDQAQYYNCLCDRSTSMVGCYTSFCAADPAAVSAAQFQTQFCQAAGSNPISGPTSSNSPPSKPLSSLPNGNPPTPTNPANIAKAIGAWSNAMVFGEFLVMLILANIL